MALNVNRAITDPFYRYKMPRIQAKVEGKGNGIKTVISNMVEIAKALERPATYPTKYFGCELGAQTQVDTKNERYIVNGEHDAGKLQDILDGFIKKFVLCPACDNPETTLTVRKQQINSKCKACGHAFIIDQRHRLATFIVKNPPKIEVDFAAAKEKKPSKTNGTNGNEAHDENESKSSSGDEVQVVDEDDDWAPETEAEKLAAGVGALVMTADLDKPLEERLDMLHNYVQEKKKKNEVGDGKALRNEAERLELKQKAPLLLANVLFDASIITEKQIEKYQKCLHQFTANDEKAQRYLLGGIEQLIAKYKEALLPRAPHIIKGLYDTDVCDEDSILKWAEKPTSKFVTKSQSKEIIAACEKVINWLKEAEEESDEEDSDDDEINFDGAKTSQLAQQNAERINKQITTINDENGEEIDIENI